MGWTLSRDLVQFGLTIGTGVGVAAVVSAAVVVGLVLLVLRGIVVVMSWVEGIQATLKDWVGAWRAKRAAKP